MARYAGFFAGLGCVSQGIMVQAASHQPCAAKSSPSRSGVLWAFRAGENVAHSLRGTIHLKYHETNSTSTVRKHSEHRAVHMVHNGTHFWFRRALTLQQGYLKLHTTLPCPMHSSFSVPRLKATNPRHRGMRGATTSADTYSGTLTTIFITRLGLTIGHHHFSCYHRGT